MINHLRDALIEKLDEQRQSEIYCTIKWSDTKQVEIIPQRYIRLPSSVEEPQIDVTYTIDINHVRRHGTVIATGTKVHCEFVLNKLLSKDNKTDDLRKDPSVRKSSDLIDDLLLMKILGKLLSKNESSNTNGEDIHHAQCASCGMNPIRHVDRYRCLECSSSTINYDLCGRCFEKRRFTNQHSTGHAMAHFRLPNEILGIQFDDVNKEVNLNNIRQMNTFRNEEHEGIRCDGECQRKNFIGLRFKCDQCPNYNLCEPCGIKKRVSTKMHKNDHPLILTSDRVLPKIDPDDIQTGEVLGRGGFGYVCVANWRSRRREVACKFIEISGASETSQQLHRSFLLELAAYRELAGPYIVRTFGYATRKLEASRVRGPLTQFMIIMELMGKGSLQNLLDKEPNKISLRRKLSMSRQIASGIRRIHQHGMVHRDIRPDNILVTDDYIAKIGDMGIARVLDPKGQQTKMGCLQFMPPEFFVDSSDGHMNCDEKLDIFTYGLTLNQFFTEVMHDFRLNASVGRITITKRSPVFYDDIIVKCIDNDSKRRPTAVEIEKIFELYEQAFSQTMTSDSYAKMSTYHKDQVFIEFYQKNKSKIQHFVKEQFPQEFIRDVPVEIIRQQDKVLHSPSDSQPQSNDPCRIN